jgi:hypothetical protein
LKVTVSISILNEVLKKIKLKIKFPHQIGLKSLQSSWKIPEEAYLIKAFQEINEIFLFTLLLFSLSAIIIKINLKLMSLKKDVTQLNQSRKFLIFDIWHILSFYCPLLWIRWKCSFYWWNYGICWDFKTKLSWTWFPSRKIKDENSNWSENSFKNFLRKKINFRRGNDFLIFSSKI